MADHLKIASDNAKHGRTHLGATTAGNWQDRYNNILSRMTEDERWAFVARVEAEIIRIRAEDAATAPNPDGAKDVA